MLVHEAACRSHRVVCVVGVAGSGKTLALRALADAYRGIDATILGAAPSGRAADELERATGIRIRTIHRLLLDAHREGGLPRGCLVVVDEAGMAETRVLAPLLHLVDRAEGKFLLVGDPAQLPAVGAGGLYQALCERLETVELTSNRRQRDPLEREALVRLRDGDAESYLAHAALRGRLAVDGNPMVAKGRLLSDWWREARRNPTLCVMLANRRADVDELNGAAHALMLRERRLGDRPVTLGDRDYRVRDNVICRRNDDRLGIRNGMRSTVISLEGDSLTLRDGAGTVRRVPFDYAAAHLDYGYALTGHAAQGVTVDRAFVLLHDQRALQEWGYVACSRARLETRLYLAERDYPERDTPFRAPDRGAPSERLARALECSSAEPLAIDQRRREDPVLSLVAKRQERLDWQRDRSSEHLANARRELASLRWWNRDRRAELEREMAFHQKALERADATSRQLDQQRNRREQRLARERERDKPMTLKPETPSRGHVVTVERERPGLGIEL